MFESSRHRILRTLLALNRCQQNCLLYMFVVRKVRSERIAVLGEEGGGGVEMDGRTYGCLLSLLRAYR